MSLQSKKVTRTFPCRCGHSWKLHDWAGPSIGDEWCNGEGKNTKYYSARCECMCYAPDNLKYLEKCLKKKSKGKLK